MRRILLATAAALSACTPSEILDPGPRDAIIIFTGTTTMAYARPRLSALMRSEAGGYTTAADVVITSTNTVVHVQLQPPPVDYVPKRLRDIVVFGAKQETFGILKAGRVQFVFYDDLDASESFQDGNEVLGPDQIIAMENSPAGYVWAPDLENQLAMLVPPVLSGYYAATDGRYTAFFPIFFTGNFDMASATASATIDLSQATIAPARFACDDGLAGPRVLDQIIQLRIDDQLAAENLCGLEFTECSTVAIDTVDPSPFFPPEWMNPYVGVIAQCRRRGGYETVVVETTRQSCNPITCMCTRTVEVNAVLTSTAEPPSWWPCDTLIPYCESTQPLYRTDARCEVMEDDP